MCPYLKTTIYKHIFDSEDLSDRLGQVEGAPYDWVVSLEVGSGGSIRMVAVTHPGWGAHPCCQDGHLPGQPGDTLTSLGIVLNCQSLRKSQCTSELNGHSVVQ